MHRLILLLDLAYVDYGFASGEFEFSVYNVNCNSLCSTYELILEVVLFKEVVMFVKVNMFNKFCIKSCLENYTTVLTSLPCLMVHLFLLFMLMWLKNTIFSLLPVHLPKKKWVKCFWCNLYEQSAYFLLFRYLLRSGNAEHPSDLLSNTTVEIFPVKSSISTNPSNTSIVIGKCNFLLYINPLAGY